MRDVGGIVRGAEEVAGVVEGHETQDQAPEEVDGIDAGAGVFGAASRESIWTLMIAEP